MANTIVNCIHLPASQQVCTRHARWLGTADLPQLDLAACPEVIHAQHRARRLLRRFAPASFIEQQAPEGARPWRAAGGGADRDGRAHQTATWTSISGDSSLGGPAEVVMIDLSLRTPLAIPVDDQDFDRAYTWSWSEPGGSRS